VYSPLAVDPLGDPQLAPVESGDRLLYRGTSLVEAVEIGVSSVDQF
jgi:hypothetical protein